jgi:O-acetyl-ADP-ribose deacetylase (regulator of RNase III)
VSGSTTFATLERETVDEPSRVKVKRAVTWRSTQMSDEHAGVTLVVAMGDLTHEQCDAIVNAANSALAHGGGVAGAISRAAGPVLDRESREWVREHGRVEAGQVAVTSAGRLRAIKHVIHAVGPLWEGRLSDALSEDEEYDIDDRTLLRGYEEDQVLRETVQHSLECAHQLRASSIALPAISSGIFGYPVSGPPTISLSVRSDVLCRCTDLLVEATMCRGVGARSY